VNFLARDLGQKEGEILEPLLSLHIDAASEQQRGI